MRRKLKQSILFKTLLILGSLIIIIFICLGYLILQNDRELISKIVNYNLSSVMETLDKNQEVQLKINQQQMEYTVNMIVKNSSPLLLDFDKNGLKKSLSFDIEKEGVQAIQIWDSIMNEMFLLALKEDGKVFFKKVLPARFTRFTKFQKPITVVEDGNVQKIGEIALYYDESIIINEIKKLKDDAKNKIDNFNTVIDKELLDAVVMKLYIAIGSLMAILAIISILLTVFVNKPLNIVKNGLDNFFLFLQNKKDFVEKINLHSNDELGQMAQSLNRNIAVSAKLHEEINELNTNLEKLVEEKTKKVTALLDNADQGFLSFGEDLIVDEEYSKECFSIFKKEISGENIANLLFDGGTKKEFFGQTLMSLLKEDNQQKINTIISLLQKEFVINNKAIQVKYKIINRDRFMLILTNITERKILERKINREKNILKMIVAVVSDSDEFFELIDDFEEFTDSNSMLIKKDKTPLHNTTELYRIIHTFKGLFSQKEMVSLVSKLHSLETQMSEALADQNNTNEELQEILDKSDFSAWLDHDIMIIKNILGDELFNERGKITVKEETLSRIEEKIIDIASRSSELDRYESVVNDLKNLKNKTIYSMFLGFPKLIDQLSQRLEKSVYPLEIIVDKDLRVNDTVKPFIKSLIHVFRNSMDHGIESMDDRFSIDKDEIGTISCSVTKNNNTLQIVIADDGAGIDIEAVKQQAIKHKIDTTAMSDDEVCYLIFSDTISTSDSITDLSGRGVGMAAVKNELDKLNGQIKINTQKNIGTSFEFILRL